MPPPKRIIKETDTKAVLIFDYVLHGLIVLAALTLASVAVAELKIYHLDVDQADATLFVGPSGKSMLIDTGEDGSGQDICRAAHYFGITEIEVLITTHHHKDHHGGVDEFTDPTAKCQMNIVSAIDRGHKPPRSIMAEHIGNYEDAIGHRATMAVAGDTIVFDPEVSVTVIAANGLLEGETGNPTNKENDASVAVLVEYKGFSAFYGGDMELHTENKIVADETVKDVSLYQANHHGADNGSSRDFLDLLKPKVIVVSNGNHAGHAHPRKAAIDRMQATIPAPTIFQTNRFSKTGCSRCDLVENVDDTFIADIDPADSTLPIMVIVDDTGQFTVKLYREQNIGPF